MDHGQFINQAIELSQKSSDDGRFPAGAVVVLNDEVVSSSVSGRYPAINHHAESDAIDVAMSQLNTQLADCRLYCSMEPCLMCLSRAYWSGIRKIYYAIKKEKVDVSGYEGSHINPDIIGQFNNKIELIHLVEHEENALQVYVMWNQNRVSQSSD